MKKYTTTSRVTFGFEGDATDEQVGKSQSNTDTTSGGSSYGR